LRSEAQGRLPNFIPFEGETKARGQRRHELCPVKVKRSLMGLFALQAEETSSH